MGLRIADAPLRRVQSAPRPKLQDDSILLAMLKNGEALSSAELDRVMALDNRREIASKGMERKRAAAQRLDVIAIKALASEVLAGDDPRSFCVPFAGYSILTSAWARVTRGSIYCYSPATGLTAGRLQRSGKPEKVAEMPTCERSLYQVPEHILAAQMMGKIQVSV